MEEEIKLERDFRERSRSHIEHRDREGERPNEKSLHRGVGEPVRYGVPGGIKKFYRVEPEAEPAASFDRIVAVPAGCLKGTLAMVMAEKKVATPEDRYRAGMEGDIEAVNNVLKITGIRMKCHLRVSRDKVADARKPFSICIRHCTAAQSVMNSIEIKDELVIEEKA